MEKQHAETKKDDGSGGFDEDVIREGVVFQHVLTVHGFIDNEKDEDEDEDGESGKVGDGNEMMIKKKKDEKKKELGGEIVEKGKEAERIEVKKNDGDEEEEGYARRRLVGNVIKEP